VSPNHVSPNHVSPNHAAVRLVTPKCLTAPNAFARFLPSGGKRSPLMSLGNRPLGARLMPQVTVLPRSRPQRSICPAWGSWAATAVKTLVRT
jgi:hypothetical protein